MDFKFSHYITITTDFGYKDSFVGIVKGVILKHNPYATIIDITHDISPQNIIEGAISIFTLKDSFPPNTIHLVIIDPTVGSSRDIILVKNGKYWFVLPDNGLISFIYFFDKKENFSVYNIDLKEKNNISYTFHGRDVFAPIVGFLSANKLEKLIVEKKENFSLLNINYPKKEKKFIEGEIIYIDHFGNAFLNIRKENLNDIELKNLKCIYGENIINFYESYYLVNKGEPLLLLNSFDFLELAINNGNFSKEYNAQIGDKVIIELK